MGLLSGLHEIGAGCCGATAALYGLLLGLLPHQGATEQQRHARGRAQSLNAGEYGRKVDKLDVDAAVSQLDDAKKAVSCSHCLPVISIVIPSPYFPGKRNTLLIYQTQTFALHWWPISESHLRPFVTPATSVLQPPPLLPRRFFVPLPSAGFASFLQTF